MSVRDPMVTVECDGGCGDTLELELTPLSGDSWDMRGVISQLRRAKWAGGLDTKTFCPECKVGNKDKQ